ncbi:hypothetical protein [Mycobacterium sp.]|uniref:hypothetical protein n=1 Tax=Mycobacterium sp. TaxID=1785 RepID=UPI003A5BC05E
MRAASGGPSPTTAPGGQTTPPGQQSTPSGGPQTTPVLVAPSTQPPHPAYVPHGAFERGTDQVGGPSKAPAGFSPADHGAPPPPPPRGFGYNDGPAPGHAPPNWVGPPPRGGWDGAVGRRAASRWLEPAMGPASA